MTATLFTSCKKDKDEEKGGIFKRPVTSVHHGKAWTWIQLGKDGNPQRLAVTLTDEALNSIPVGEGDHSGEHDRSNMDNNWTLKFHPKAGITPFNHLGMGWNPLGYEPEPIYGIPHFDFHFYMTSP